MSLGQTVVICNALCSIAIYGAFTWVVFGMGNSPWWFILAVLLDIAASQSNTETKAKSL